MKIYSPGDIAKLLKIKESTLRKYSLLLEKVGYKFQRNNQNQRWYSDIDVIALQKFVTLKDNSDMSLKECANSVLMWDKGESITEPSTVTGNVTERYSNDETEIKSLIYKQNELISELSKRLDQQDKYIKNTLNKNNELLMQLFNQGIEAEKQLASGKENKKGFFSRLFKK